MAEHCEACEDALDAERERLDLQLAMVAEDRFRCRAY
jgi:hypothetical protein